MAWRSRDVPSGWTVFLAWFPPVPLRSQFAFGNGTYDEKILQEGEGLFRTQVVLMLFGCLAWMLYATRAGSVEVFVANLHDFLHTMAAFSVLYQRSIIPFSCGWYAVVRRWSIPSSRDNSWNNRDSNCLPWSVVMRAGTPNLEIHEPMSAEATVLACMSSIAMASGQRV